jgi:lipopolysaccharide biosynthesis regulator YciM
MREFERKQLLERVDRESATVGASIPDEVDVQGETLELASFVFEVKRHDRVPEDLQSEVKQAKRLLRRERKERRERIEDGDISREAGEREAEVVIGLDRALHALENLGPTNIEAEEEAQERADQKRWFSFLQDALGKDDTRGVGR